MLEIDELKVSELRDLGYEVSTNSLRELFQDVISQSNYLYLLFTDGVYHLRREVIKGEEVNESHTERDTLLVNYLLTNYKIYFDEDFSTRKSGDMNRSVLSLGKLIK
jgi:hypothetical protein